MTTSNILAITQLAENQAQAFTTINEAVSNLEQAQNRKLIVATSNASVVVTLQQFVRNFFFSITGNTSAINLTFPGRTETPVITTSPYTSRVFTVSNAGTGTITVKSDIVAGTTSSLIAGEAAMFHIEGKDIVKLMSSTGVGGGASTGVLTLAFSTGGAVPAASELFRYVATETLTFADDFAGSRGTIGTNPTASLVLTVLINGVSIGTITVSTAGVFTFFTSAAIPVTIAAGDILTVTSATLDASAANLAVTLKGTR